jgi:hypothetical protein
MAAEPYKIAETRWSPNADLSRRTSSESFSSNLRSSP